MKALFTCFSLILLLQTKSFAFEHELHGDISARAYDLIERCALNAEISPELIKGTVEEDTTEPTSRLANWHFYNTYGNLRQGPALFESLDHIFKKRHKQLKKLDTKSGQENHKGRILHYIQDMFVPAHVVPVFHGKPFDKTDEFDHFLLTEEEKAEVLSQINCADLDKEAKSLAKTKNQFERNKYLLDHSAQQTLTKIKSPIADSTIPWSYFWREPISKKFDPCDLNGVLIALGIQSKRFGTYHGSFGEDRELIWNGQRYEIEELIYKQFFGEQFASAVKASGIFILVNQ